MTVHDYAPTWQMRITMKHVRRFTVLVGAALLLGLAGSPVLARHPDKAKQATEYPDATRVAPKLDLTSEKDQKKLQAGLDALLVAGRGYAIVAGEGFDGAADALNRLEAAQA